MLDDLGASSHVRRDEDIGPVIHPSSVVIVLVSCRSNLLQSLWIIAAFPHRCDRYFRRRDSFRPFWVFASSTSLIIEGNLRKTTTFLFNACTCFTLRSGNDDVLTALCIRRTKRFVNKDLKNVHFNKIQIQRNFLSVDLPFITVFLGSV